MPHYRAGLKRVQYLPFTTSQVIFFVCALVRRFKITHIINLPSGFVLTVIARDPFLHCEFAHASSKTR